MKLLMLTALVSAQRGQSLHMLDIRFMKEGETQFDFLLPEHIKQSRPRYKPPSVMLKAYPTDKTLCVVSHMKEYLRRTKPLRGDSTKLFISFMKPHKHISRKGSCHIKSKSSMCTHSGNPGHCRLVIIKNIWQIL